MIIQGSPDILRGPQGLNGFGDFGGIGAFKTVEELYQGIIGRQVSSDPSSPFYDAGLKYFQDRFGSEISAEETAIFEQMAAAEVAQREAYFNELERQRGEARQAGIAITLRQQLDADAAVKKAIADAATAAQNTSKAAADIAAKARADAAAAAAAATGGAGINPALILAAAAAAFFIGG
jgi:hypothetical protein